MDSSDAEGFLRRMNNAGLQKKDPLDIITAEMVQRACVEQAGLTASGKEAVAESAESARSFFLGSWEVRKTCPFWLFTVRL